MKKTILNLGKTLNKGEQQAINGGNRGCYNEPRTDVPCVSPWIYIQGCGWTCMTAPIGPDF